MDDSLSTTFAALADPTRRAILARLAQGDATVGELAEPFAMSLPAISKHLKVLELAGLVSKRREAQTRPCTLNGAPLREAEAWLQQYRRFFEASLDRLDQHVVDRLVPVLGEARAAHADDRHPVADPGAAHHFSSPASSGRAFQK